MNGISESEVRLGQLARDDYWLRIKCRNCDHFSTLDPNSLSRMYGGRKLLRNCTFNCTSCKGTVFTVKFEPGHVVRKRSNALKG